MDDHTGWKAGELAEPDDEYCLYCGAEPSDVQSAIADGRDCSASDVNTCLWSATRARQKQASASPGSVREEGTG